MKPVCKSPASQELLSKATVKSRDVVRKLCEATTVMRSLCPRYCLSYIVIEPCSRSSTRLTYTGCLRKHLRGHVRGKQEVFFYCNSHGAFALFLFLDVSANF
jgi:hypothetical protein